MNTISQQILSGVSPPWRRRKPHVYVVLPAFNEAENLPGLLEELDQTMHEAHQPYDVIVVDDGSKDNTLEIAQHYSTQMPVTVERHVINQGLGRTIADGLRLAASLCSAKDIVVTLDADNTHTPTLIPRMIPLVQEGNDVVIASRYQNGSYTRGVPWYRNWMSYGARWLCTTIFPIPGVRDYTCGYRAYRGEILKKAVEAYGDSFVREPGFQCMLEILLRLHKIKAIFNEVPLVLRYDLKGGVSKMRVGSTVMKTLSLLFRRRFGWS